MVYGKEEGMKRILVLFICGALFFCGASAVFSAGSDTATGTVSILSWQYLFPDPTTTPGARLAADFAKKYPNITLDLQYSQYNDLYTRLKVGLASGTGPDVFGLQVAAPLKEFDAYAARDLGAGWKAKFVGGALGQIDAGGPILALPGGLSFAGTMWADLTILGKYGLKPPTTWTELRQVTSALRAKGELPMVIGAKDPWINLDVFLVIAGDLVGGNIQKAIEGTYSWTSPGIVKAFDFWQRCFTEKVFQDGAMGVSMYMDAYNLWDVDGRVALQPNGSWEMGSFSPASGDNYPKYMRHRRDVFRMPDFSGDGKPAPVLSAPDAIYGINKGGKNKENAWRLVKFIVFEEYQQSITDGFAFFPVLKGIAPKVQLTDDQKRIYARYQDYGKASLGFREIPYPDLKQALSDQLALLAVGGTTPSAAATAMEKASRAQQR
jgi:raffinose/stachyose/melibiose transport system substrate-binding protein